MMFRRLARKLAQLTYVSIFLSLVVLWGSGLWWTVQLSSGYLAVDCNFGKCWLRFLTGPDADRLMMRSRRIYPESKEFQVTITSFQISNRDWWHQDRWHFHCAAMHGFCRTVNRSCRIVLFRRIPNCKRERAGWADRSTGSY